MADNNSDIIYHPSMEINNNGNEIEYNSRKGSNNRNNHVNEYYLNFENESNKERIYNKYIPDLHALGKERQALDFKIQELGIPGQVSTYHAPDDEANSEKATLYDENGLPIRNKFSNSEKEKKLWSWTSDGKLKLSCSQPIIPVSVVQDVVRRDKIILIPQVEITDVVIPKVYNQNIMHDVPKLNIKVEDTHVKIPNVKYVDKEIIIPIITGYTHKFVPKWEIHEVPRPIVKYIGEQKIVEVEVPEIKYVDKIVEREVIVDTVEKKVPKIIEIPKYVDEVQYVWKPIEKVVYVQKLVPKFDVNLECPPPLIVPYPVQTVKEMPPVMVKKDTKIPEYGNYDLDLPDGSVRIPEEYIKRYSKKPKFPIGCFSPCCESNINNENDKNDCSMNSLSYNKIDLRESDDGKLNVLSDSKSVLDDNNIILKESEQLIDVTA